MGIFVVGGEHSVGALDWNAIYAEQVPRVYNYFRFRLGHEADTEDLTSRTFEKAWRARANYSGELANVSTWLFKIAQNTCTDYFRSRRNQVSLDSIYDIAATEDLLHVVETESDLAKLARLTAELPARERELIALKYGSELSHGVIAQVMGLSESNVGVILHRTVQALRSKW